MPFVVAVVIRIILFLAAMIPALRWFTRRVRGVQGIPTDREVVGTVDRETELWRGTTAGTGV